MRRRKLYIITIGLVLLLALTGVFAVWFVQYMPNMAVIKPFEDVPETRLIIDGNLIRGANPPIIKDGRILLPYDTIKENIDKYIWYDEALQKVTITTRDRVIRMKTGSLEALINEKPMELKFPAVDENDSLYLPIELLHDLYGISLQYIPENDVVIIDFMKTEARIAYPINAKTVVRNGMNIREPIIKQFLGEGEKNLDVSRIIENELLIFDENEEWFKVRANDGALGFVKKNEIEIVGVKKVEMKTSTDVKPILTQGKINLVWEMTYSKSNIKFVKENAPGIDVVSPTWFEIVDRKGTIKNRATPDYIEFAHKNGWQVWALFANAFKDIEGTSLLLNNSDKRQEIIRNILAYAALYKLDGINLDFENIYKKDRDAYTQFVREFYPLAREQGLVVSVDVSVPDGSDNWSKCFDRKALAESVDYICLMTYDQHWSTSPKAGSTAELVWVEENLQKTIEEVPSEKLLLGIPLFTRIWSVEESDAGTKVSSKAFNVTNAWKEIDENDAQVAWNHVSGQYEASYKKDGITYHLWLEDANAVNMKTSLIHKYELAGACVWAVNFADAQVYDTLNRNLKQIQSYDEWKKDFSGPIENK